MQQLQALIDRDVPCYCKYGIHPRDDWPENNTIDKLDWASKSYLESIITSHEAAAKSPAADVGLHARKPEPPAPQLTIGQHGIPEARNHAEYVKYSDEFTGPLPVLDKKESKANKLQLPDACKIYDVFHAMVLRPYIEYQDPVRKQLIRKRRPTSQPHDIRPPAIPTNTAESPPSSRT